MILGTDYYSADFLAVVGFEEMYPSSSTTELTTMSSTTEVQTTDGLLPLTTVFPTTGQTSDTASSISTTSTQTTATTDVSPTSVSSFTSRNGDHSTVSQNSHTGSTFAPGVTTQNGCACDCSVYFNSTILTPEELETKLQEIKSILTLEKNSLSSSIRRKISASDDRPSARSIGAVGVAVLVSVLLAIIAMDIDIFIHFIRGRKYSFSTI